MDFLNVFVFAFAYAHFCHGAATDAQLAMNYPPAQELSESAQEKALQQKRVSL